MSAAKENVWLSMITFNTLILECHVKKLFENQLLDKIFHTVKCQVCRIIIYDVILKLNLPTLDHLMWMVFITKGSYGCSVSIVLYLFFFSAECSPYVGIILYVLILMQYFIFQHFFLQIFLLYKKC